MGNDRTRETDQAHPENERLKQRLNRLFPPGSKRRTLAQATAAVGVLTTPLIAANTLGVSTAPPSHDSPEQIKAMQQQLQRQQVERGIAEGEKTPKPETSEQILTGQTNEIYDGSIELTDPAFTVLNTDTPDNQRVVGINRIQELGSASIPTDSDIAIIVRKPAIHSDGTELVILLPGMVDGQGRALSVPWNPVNSDRIRVIEKGKFEEVRKATMNNGQLDVQTAESKTEPASQVSVQIINH